MLSDLASLDHDTKGLVAEEHLRYARTLKDINLIRWYFAYKSDSRLTKVLFDKLYNELKALVLKNNDHMRFARECYPCEEDVRKLLLTGKHRKQSTAGSPEPHAIEK